MLWDSGVSYGLLAISLLWGLSFGLVFTAMASAYQSAQLGLCVAALAVTLSIVRDNQKTRRMVRVIARGGDDDVRRLR